jgi:hypothetical protein
MVLLNIDSIMMPPVDRRVSSYSELKCGPSSPLLEPPGSSLYTCEAVPRRLLGKVQKLLSRDVSCQHLKWLSPLYLARMLILHPLNCRLVVQSCACPEHSPYPLHIAFIQYTLAMRRTGNCTVPATDHMGTGTTTRSPYHLLARWVLRLNRNRVYYNTLSGGFTDWHGSQSASAQGNRPKIRRRVN